MASSRTIREFLTEFNDGDIQVVPNPESNEQVGLANRLSKAVTIYELDLRHLKGARSLLLKEFRDKLDSVPLTNPYAEEGELFDEKVHLLTEATTAYMKSELELMYCINAVRAHGMVHPGEGLTRKLRECQEENRILSRQILEYKAQLGLK